MWKVVQLEKYFDFSLLSLPSFLSAPEKEVTSPSDFKVVGALRYIWNIVERGVKHHNPIPNTTSLWFYSLMLQRSIKCQFYNLWFDPIMAWTHQFPEFKPSILSMTPPMWFSVCRYYHDIYICKQSFWNSSDLGGRKSWGPPITSVMPFPMSAKHFWMVCTFLTEVRYAGRIVNTGSSSVNSEFVTALNTWYLICFW
jgi:hypothetical protein